MELNGTMNSMESGLVWVYSSFNLFLRFFKYRYVGYWLLFLPSSGKVVASICVIEVRALWSCEVQRVLFRHVSPESRYAHVVCFKICCMVFWHVFGMFLACFWHVFVTLLNPKFGCQVLGSSCVPLVEPQLPLYDVQRLHDLWPGMAGLSLKRGENGQLLRHFTGQIQMI